MNKTIYTEFLIPSIFKIYVLDNNLLNNYFSEDSKNNYNKIKSTLIGMFDILINPNYNLISKFIRDDLFKEYVPNFSDLQDYKRDEEKILFTTDIRNKIINKAFFDIVTEELIPILKNKLSLS